MAFLAAITFSFFIF
jgi:hypothetical protein